MEIDNIPAGKTPLVTDVQRKKRHEIRFIKEGYAEEVKHTTRGFNWWFIGNIFTLFGIGIIVDFITGSVYTVNPDEMTVKLKELT